MPISTPQPNLTEIDKKLLVLIAKHLLEKSENCPSNVPTGHIALSDSEAENLLDLLHALLTSDKFEHARRFIKNISDPQENNIREAKLIFSTAIIEIGQSITHHRWYELLARLGIKKHKYMGKDIRRMQVDHFFQMERKLFQYLEFDPRIIALLMELGEAQYSVISSYLEEGRGHTVDLAEPVNKLKKRLQVNGVASRIDLSAVAFVLSNSSMLFTTRDWTAAGALSCIAGNAIGIIKSNK